MNTAVAVRRTPKVEDIASHRASALIRKGQRAWSAIKGTAAEQRFWWLDVGTALIEGKDRANRKGGQKFSEWVQEMFPGLHERDAQSAMEYANKTDILSEIPAGLSHPRAIMDWHREQQATAALPTDAPAINTKTTQEFDSQRDAEKFIKVDQRAETGGEGSETADRMRRAIAKAHGSTVSGLRRAAAQQAPDMAHRFTPSHQLSIDRMRSTLRDSALAMEASGISKDAVKDIFTQFTNSL